jgi:hypothetical protein
MGLWACWGNKTTHTYYFSTSGSWPCLLFPYMLFPYKPNMSALNGYYTFKNFKKKQWLKLHDIPTCITSMMDETQALYSSHTSLTNRYPPHPIS